MIMIKRRGMNSRTFSPNPRKRAKGQHKIVATLAALAAALVTSLKVTLHANWTKPATLHWQSVHLCAFAGQNWRAITACTDWPVHSNGKGTPGKQLVCCCFYLEGLQIRVQRQSGGRRKCQKVWKGCLLSSSSPPIPLTFWVHSSFLVRGLYSVAFPCQLFLANDHGLAKMSLAKNKHRVLSQYNYLPDHYCHSCGLLCSWEDFCSWFKLRHVL